GLLALQEPMAGPVQPPIYPLMWAREPGSSFLLDPVAMRALIEGVGFVARSWEDVTAELAGRAPAPPHRIQRIIMGDALEAISRAGDTNREQGRIVMVQAVFGRQG